MNKPTTAAAVQKFLSSGAIKGIGPAISKKIVDHLGVGALKALDDVHLRFYLPILTITSST